jgi:hypothetical protein
MRRSQGPLRAPDRPCLGSVLIVERSKKDLKTFNIVVHISICMLANDRIFFFQLLDYKLNLTGQQDIFLFSFS